MNIEITIEGRKSFLNWDNVAYMVSIPSEQAFQSEVDKTQICFDNDNVCIYPDQTYDEIKNIIEKKE